MTLVRSTGLASLLAWRASWRGLEAVVARPVACGVAWQEIGALPSFWPRAGGIALPMPDTIIPFQILEQLASEGRAFTCVS